MEKKREEEGARGMLRGGQKREKEKKEEEKKVERSFLLYPIICHLFHSRKEKRKES